MKTQILTALLIASALPVWASLPPSELSSAAETAILPSVQEIENYKEKLRLEVKEWLESTYLGTPAPDGQNKYASKDIAAMLEIYDAALDYMHKNNGRIVGFSFEYKPNISNNEKLMNTLLRFAFNAYKYIKIYSEGEEEKDEKPLEIKKKEIMESC